MEDLRSLGTREGDALAARHLEGDFDATTNESEGWAESPDGKAAFEQLIKRGH